MQNGVSITTHDSELNIVYGLMDLREERELARASARYILTDLNNIRSNYIRLGFHLYECSKMKYYEDFGYATMEEFCEKNFGLDKTAVSRCINVCLEFSQKENYRNGTKSGECLLRVDDKWSKYNYSQLCEMLPLTDEQRYQIKPEMSIKQIREFKKNLKKKPEKTDDKEVTTSQQAKPLNMSDICTLSGAALQSRIKKAPGKHAGCVVYDKNGKQVMSRICDLVLENDGNYYFRLWQSIEELEKNKEKPGE